MTEPPEVWEYRKRVAQAAQEWAMAEYRSGTALLKEDDDFHQALRKAVRKMDEFMDILYAGPEPTEEDHDAGT